MIVNIFSLCLIYFSSKIFVVVLFQWKMQCCRVRRGGSRGFVLRDETVDEEFLKESLEAEQKWLGRFRQSQGPMFQRKDTSASSKYSFSTEYNSGKYPKDIACHPWNDVCFRQR